MFTIHTARPGEAWHTLHPIERLGHAVPSMSFDCELRLAVRVDHGDPNGPYLIRAFLVDSTTGQELEVVTLDDFVGRRQAVEDNEGPEEADTWADTVDLFVATPACALGVYVRRLEDHFRALMALDLFRLPVNC